jgi:hypothetical protein
MKITVYIIMLNDSEKICGSINSFLWNDKIFVDDYFCIDGTPVDLIYKFNK